MKAWVHKQKGFTIVELLIVIVVIAILATITIVSYNGIQVRSRDASRDSAVANIRKSIEMYKSDTGAYPNVCNSTSGCNISGLASFVVPTYVRSVPNDPDQSKQISYVLNSTLDGYGLYVLYESKPVCKYLVGNTPKVNNGWWGVSVPAC